MIYAAIFSLFLGAVLGHSSARIYHPRGLNETTYEPLWKGFNPEICFAHGTEGLKGLIGDLSACGKVVVYGATPTREQIQSLRNTPTLIVAGTRDGVSPIFPFAATKHSSQYPEIKFAAIDGAAHGSILSDGCHSYDALSRDLKASRNSKEVQEILGAMVSEFSNGVAGAYLTRAMSYADELAAPIVEALTLEGSAALGEPQCNSDYPTNPTCQYPIYPGKSMPPGPAPAPDPPLSSNCVCGSPWVMTVGSTINANFADSPRPDATLITNNAFHDVTDIHPFHLPNIFNECSEDLSQPCALNLTTVSQAVLQAGDLFPEDAVVLSAFELKTKFKSRQAIWERAGLGKGTPDLDQGTNQCKEINEQAYQWALDNAEPSVREYFELYGEPYVMVDDVEAPIGDHGPTWIEEEMVYTRVVDETTGKSRIEIQSWSFVVKNTKNGDLPWFFPVGMHYCKLLSPARAMEWIYSEGVRFNANTDSCQ